VHLEEEEARLQAMVERRLHTLQDHHQGIPTHQQVARPPAMRARQLDRLKDTAGHRRPILVRREDKEEEDKDQVAHRPTLQHLRDRVCIFVGMQHVGM
jgi:hypothetical protein